MRDAVPVRNDGFVVRKLGDETLVLAESGEEVHLLDEVGTFIWERIDGARTVGDIAGAVASTYEVDPAEAESDAEEFLEELLGKGVIRMA
ncbi:MAG: PqqD family protein [Planctomycetes bacterium]|nr:PqqD family protein [Planctomycetota bacterium]